MKRKNRLCLLVFLVFTTTPIYSQEVIATSGEYFENSIGSLSFTLGEIAIETLDSDAITLSQGFQQPGLTVTQIREIDESSFHLEVYPNPASSFVILKFSEQAPDNLMYRLVDPTGKTRIQKRVEGRETTVHLENCAPGLYLLQITEPSREAGTYRIIKQ